MKFKSGQVKYYAVKNIGITYYDNMKMAMADGKFKFLRKLHSRSYINNRLERCRKQFAICHEELLQKVMILPNMQLDTDEEQQNVIKRYAEAAGDMCDAEAEKYALSIYENIPGFYPFDVQTNLEQSMRWNRTADSVEHMKAWLRSGKEYCPLGDKGVNDD